MLLVCFHQNFRLKIVYGILEINCLKISWEMMEFLRVIYLIVLGLEIDDSKPFLHFV